MLSEIKKRCPKKHPRNLLTDAKLRDIEKLASVEHPLPQTEMAKNLQVSRQNLQNGLKINNAKKVSKKAVHKLFDRHKVIRVSKSRKLYRQYSAGSKYKFVVMV